MNRPMSRETQLVVTGYFLKDYQEEHGDLPMAEYVPAQRDDYWTIRVGMYEEAVDEIDADAFAPERLRSDFGKIDDTTTRFFPLWDSDDEIYQGLLLIEGPSASTYAWQGAPSWSLEEIRQYYTSRPDQEFWILREDMTASLVTMGPDGLVE